MFETKMARRANRCAIFFGFFSAEKQHFKAYPSPCFFS